MFDRLIELHTELHKEMDKVKDGDYFVWYDDNTPLYVAVHDGKVSITELTRYSKANAMLEYVDYCPVAVIYDGNKTTRIELTEV